MSDGAQRAREALLEAIPEALEDVKSKNIEQRARVIRELAYAYRLVSGGPQPGSIVAEK